MNENEIINVETKFSAAVFSRRPLVAIRGKGALIWDINGKEYIDCASAYGVSVVGHCHPKVVSAIKRQAGLLIACHSSLYNNTRANFLRKLMDITPIELKKTFLANSGTEAVETAIKLARRYTRKPEIIAFTGGYHGKTLGSLSATWKKKYRTPFEPLVPGFKHVPYGKIDGLNEVITEKTAAIIVEPIQGESGVNIPPENFLKDLGDLCKKKKILLIFDEIQTGFGRTGRLFAFENTGVIPDILCLAKSIGGGVPLGITVSTEEIMASFKLGDHTSTFSGNPLICAAASAALDVILDERLPERAEVLGQYFKEKLEGLKNQYSIIRAVRGKGLMIGMELRFDVLNIILSSLKRNVILLDAGRNILRFLPPLVISKKQIDQVVYILNEVIGEENAKLRC